MASYVVPQVEIHQLFSEIPVALAQNQVAFVFGPNYLLHRYEDAESRKSIAVGGAGFKYGAGFSIDEYPSALDDDMIDYKSGYTKLYGDNVLVKLADLNVVGAGVDDDGYDYISIQDTVMKRKPKAGDHVFIRLTSGDDTFDYGMVVKDLERVNVTGSSDSSYEYELRVVFENTFDTSGAAGDYTAFLCESHDGVEIKAKAWSDHEGGETIKTWEADRRGVHTTEHNELYAEIIDDDYRYHQGHDEEGRKKVSVNWGQIVMADLYVEYRELLTTYSDTVHSVLHASEVEDMLGAVSPDNPLAQAVYNAALNAGGQVVRFMAVETDDLNGYNRVLEAATLTKQVYFMVPATRNVEVLDAVQNHVYSMSANPVPGARAIKHWRIAFVSAEIPEEAPIYTQASHPYKQDYIADYTMKMVEGISSLSEFVLVGDKNDGLRFNRDVKKGDIVRLPTNKFDRWGEAVAREAIITKVVNNYTAEAKLTVPFDEDSSDSYQTGGLSSGPFEIYHPYTAGETAEEVRNISSSFRDRRMYNVYPTHFVGGGKLQTGEFAAAAVAGLVSSCLPQQPVTNLELVGIDDIPLVYQTFTVDQLDTMASGGTFIVMQDLPGDQVYVRHQISTDYEANNLNTAELSITKNLDSISYFFDDLTSPYIGKYNITPDLLAVLRNVISGGISYLERTEYGLYGPQVIADGTEILLLEQDALLKDHVNCNLKLNLPYPFNHLVLKLFV